MSDPNESRDPLPKTARGRAPEVPAELPGTVILQRVRCGKPSCRCASGDPADLHGPYPYRFWREHGTLRKAYVRRDDLEATRRACRARQDAERQQRATRHHFDALLLDFRTRSREVEQLLAAWRETLQLP